MDAKAEELLKQFQNDYNRILEENFAQTLSENENVRLFFINEDQAFTDGKNIVVDPAVGDLFADRKALDDITEFLHWPKVMLVDSWNALRIITRAQTIHECLHVLYTDFPPRLCRDPKCNTKNKKTVMSLINNIIEDTYIEAVGCSFYDNMEFYLKFGRVSQCFYNRKVEGTASRALASSLPQQPQPGDEPKPPTKAELLLDYLDYMATLLLYPFVKISEPSEEIKTYIDKTKQLFLDGCVAASSAERYEYCSKIFDEILDLIPDDSEELNTQSVQMVLGGNKTHGANQNSIGDDSHKGKSQAVITRLFVDKEGNPKDDKQNTGQMMQALAEFAKDKKQAMKLVNYQGHSSSFSGDEFGAAPVHKNIKIVETYPKINLGLRKAYQNIYNRYKVNINSYNSRFVQLLKSHAMVQEEKFKFGSGITSKRLGDPQKRFWYRNMEGTAVPDMAVMLLIDGSGSMEGERRHSAMCSAVILHEVLKKQGITHSVIEHRAVYDEEQMNVNILLSFDGREEEKYNIMQLEADDNSRDGLALYWAGKYFQKVNNEHKVLIVISDGEPCHSVDDYYPPVSTKDTANVARKLIKQGINVVAISLDEKGDYSCYDALKEIYPTLIGCDDLKRLTGQLLGVIAKLL